MVKEPTKAETEVAEEENSVIDSQPIEQEATPEVEEPKTEETVQAESEETKEPEPQREVQKSELKPVEKRIHKLVDERDQERARADSLSQQVDDLLARLNESTPAVTPPSPFTVEPGSEVTPEQYKEDVVRTAQSIAQLEVQKQRIVDTIQKESHELMQTYPVLNPDSDAYDKELSDMITEAVKAQIQVNPTASVKKLGEKLMKPYTRAVEKKVAETAETITKQVSESALRPTQVKPGEKPFEDLSIPEMEEKLGKVY